MNINKLIKKQAFLSLISLALIAFIVTGSSYALFQSSVVDSNIHSVTTPNFVISYLNSSGKTLSNSDALNIDNLIQTSDADALASTSNIYKYKITNTGTIPYRFKAYVQINPNYLSGGINNPSGSLNLLDLYYIKYETNYETVKALASKAGQSNTDKIQVFPSTSNTPNVNDVINPGQTKEFYIRLWLRKDVDVPNSAIGSETHLQLVIEGESVTNEEVAPKGWNTSSSGTLLAALKTNNPLKIPQSQIGEASLQTSKLTTTNRDGVMFVHLSDLDGETVGYSNTYCKYCSDIEFNTFNTLTMLSNSDMSSTLKGKYIWYDDKIWYVNGFKEVSSGRWAMYISLQETTSTTDETTFAGTEDSFGISYYYRGKSTNNFVQFAGMCWRIVRIEGNGNIKLTLYNRSGTSCTTTGNNLAFIPNTNGTYTTSFNDNGNDNAYVGYKYGTTGSTSFIPTHYPTNDSVILTQLKDWYDKKLRTYDSYIADSVWCNDKKRGSDGRTPQYAPYSYQTSAFASSNGYGTNLTLYAGTTRNMKTSTITSTATRNKSNVAGYQQFTNINISSATPSLKCEIPAEYNILSNFTAGTTKEGNKALNGYKIGLLTLDEVIYAGGSVLRPNGKYYLMENASATGSTLMEGWWTMTPAGFFSLGDTARAIIFYVNYNGTGLISYTYADYPLGIRPAISLKPTVKISSGNGTASSPYVISSAS